MKRERARDWRPRSMNAPIYSPTIGLGVREKGRCSENVPLLCTVGRSSSVGSLGSVPSRQVVDSTDHARGEETRTISFSPPSILGCENTKKTLHTVCPTLIMNHFQVRNLFSRPATYDEAAVFLHPE